MADTENEIHSDNLPVLQLLSPTHFVNEKVCSSQKQQEQPRLQTCLNNSFQLFADMLLSKYENLTSKIVKIILPGPRRRDLGKVNNLMMREQTLNRHQIHKVSLMNR